MVLAGGDSTRMGTPKALLPDGEGRVFVTRLVHTFSAAGFREVAVVTGRAHAEIVRAIAQDPPPGVSIIVARNPDPSRGQLSSLLTGLDVAARHGVRAVLMTLVDVPFVSAATVSVVVSEYEARRALIVRPARGIEHGHPVLFDRSLFEELRRADPARGAKTVVHAHSAEIVNLEIDDPGAFLDIDTRDEYQKLVLGR
jgi:molybdenum cofactor cytidylyltransferase